MKGGQRVSECTAARLTLGRLWLFRHVTRQMPLDSLASLCCCKG